MLKGSCLCGGVRYEIDGEVGPMAQCYCSMCRKQHGTSFAAYVGVKASDFHWVKGEELVASYQSSPGLKRGFCRTCGSNLPVPDPAEQTFFIPAGTLDDDPGAPRGAHLRRLEGPLGRDHRRPAAVRRIPARLRPRRGVLSAGRNLPFIGLTRSARFVSSEASSIRRQRGENYTPSPEHDRSPDGGANG